MKARDIINILEKKFPKINAEEWDNVGLLIGDYDKEIKKIQFSLDATLEGIENAISKKVDMLITHHPIIFKAIKDITEQNILGKKIRDLIKNDINVYAIHTNLDSSINGLNDYILKKLGHSKREEQIVIGFAAETTNVLEYAKAKLEKKKADVIIANDVSNSRIGFNSDHHQVTLLTKDGHIVNLPENSKEELALNIWESLIEEKIVH